MNIVWSRTAVEDLKHLRDYIAQHDPKAAARVAKAILESVENLGDYPAIGRPGRLPHTREIVVPNTPFVVVYTVAERRVEVIAVIHGARKWPDDPAPE